MDAVARLAVRLDPRQHSAGLRGRSEPPSTLPEQVALAFRIYVPPHPRLLDDGTVTQVDGYWRVGGFAALKPEERKAVKARAAEVFATEPKRPEAKGFGAAVRRVEEAVNRTAPIAALEGKGVSEFGVEPWNRGPGPVVESEVAGKEFAQHSVFPEPFYRGGGPPGGAIIPESTDNLSLLGRGVYAISGANAPEHVGRYGDVRTVFVNVEHPLDVYGPEAKEMLASPEAKRLHAELDKQKGLIGHAAENAAVLQAIGQARGYDALYYTADDGSIVISVWDATDVATVKEEPDTALARLARVVVPRHKRVVKGKVQDVETYTYERRGGGRATVTQPPNAIAPTPATARPIKKGTGTEVPLPFPKAKGRRVETWKPERFARVWSPENSGPVWPVKTGYPPETQTENIGRQAWLDPNADPDYPDRSEIRHIKGIAESMRAEGQRSPIKLVEDPDYPGYFIYADGHHRFYAALHAGLADIKVEIVPWSERRSLAKHGAAVAHSDSYLQYARKDMGLGTPGMGSVAEPQVFTDGEAADSWGRQGYQAWADSLSAKQKESLLDYGATGYRWVNSILRGTEEAMRTEWNEGEGYEDVKVADIKRMYEQWVPDLDAAFAKPGAKTPDTVVAYRGAPVNDLKVGDTFTDEAFVSTSLTKDRADDFKGYVDEKAEIAASGEGYAMFSGQKGATFEITVPKGTPAIYVDAARDKAWEHELLLGRGLKYKVTSLDPPRMEVVSG